MHAELSSKLEGYRAKLHRVSKMDDPWWKQCTDQTQYMLFIGGCILLILLHLRRKPTSR